MTLTIATFCLLLSTGWAVDPPPAPVGPSNKEKAEINRLIHDLANSDFEVRDAAFQRLSKWEGKAYRQLHIAEATSLDAETRHRCGLLLPAARAADMNTRIAAFLADTKGEYSHELPGLNKFMNASYAFPAAREMFIEMIRDHGTQRLLLVAESDPDSIPLSVVSRAMEMQSPQVRGARLPPAGLVVGAAIPRPPVVNSGNGHQPSPAELLGLFFVDSLSPKTAHIRRSGIGPSTFLYQPALRALLVSTGADAKHVALTDERAKVARAIIQGWFESREDVYEVNLAINYAIQFDMPDVAIHSATKQLGNKQAISALRGQAIVALGRFAKTRTIPELETLLKDETPAGVRYEQESDENGKIISKPYPIQSRDLAFAMLLHAKGIKPTDYGMKMFSTSESMKYQATNHWFKSDEDRIAAFKKFMDENQKSPSKPEK